MSNSHEITLSLKVVRFDDISHEELTELLSLSPTKTHKKGAPKNPGKPEGPTRKYNSWIYEVPCEKSTPFEIQLAHLLDIIESRIEAFKILSNQHILEIGCVLYLRYDSNESIPSIHLDSRYRDILKEVNFEFDLDLYCG